MTSKEALDNLRFDVLMLHNIDYIRTNNECDIIEKDLEVLEQLEDIEEELEIDLITLFKALRKGIYVKQYGQIEHYFLKLLSDGINLYLTNYGGTRVILSQDYYGKTWALTKEEWLEEHDR